MRLNTSPAGRLRKKSGFTVIEVIAVLVIMGVLAAVSVVNFFDLQKDVAIVVLKNARAELNARERIAWAKYKTGSMSWEDLSDPDTITGGAAGFGDYRVQGGLLMAPDKFSMTVDIARSSPTISDPGIWKLGEFHQ